MPCDFDHDDFSRRLLLTLTRKTVIVSFVLNTGGMAMTTLTIEPHAYRGVSGFRVYERGRNGWGTDAFLKTLPGAKLFAIGTLEDNEVAKDGALFNETDPHFTTALFEGLIANAVERGYIRFRGFKERRPAKRAAVRQ